jgi:hypothetical protein
MVPAANAGAAPSTRHTTNAVATSIDNFVVDRTLPDILLPPWPYPLSLFVNAAEHLVVDPFISSGSNTNHLQIRIIAPSRAPVNDPHSFSDNITEGVWFTQMIVLPRESCLKKRR